MRVGRRAARVTAADLRCDVCGIPVAGPESSVRFVYHPGDNRLRDDSGLLCDACWRRVTQVMDPAHPPRACAVCGVALVRGQGLFLRRFDEATPWELCRDHAVAFLNTLRTLPEKLDPTTFRFPTLPPEIPDAPDS